MLTSEGLVEQSVLRQMAAVPVIHCNMEDVYGRDAISITRVAAST